MNLNKYTEKAQEAVLGSQKLAEQSSHALVEPEHLLVALVEQHEGIVPEVLRNSLLPDTYATRATGESVSGVSSISKSCRTPSSTYSPLYVS